MGFGSSKKDREGAIGASNKSGAAELENDAAAYEAELAGMSDDEGSLTEEQVKAISVQFQ